MTKLFLRNAHADDIESIMDILADGRSALASLEIDQWQGFYPHEDIIKQDIDQVSSYVVEDDNGQLIATVMIGFDGEEDYCRIDNGSWLTQSPLDSPTYAVIHRMAVKNSSRGSGVARFILSQAEEIAFAMGSKSLRIDTHPGNIPMIKLLERAGYRYCGIIYIDHAEGSNPERFAFEKLVGATQVINVPA